MLKIKPCPNCGSTNIRKVNILSRYLRPKYIECWDCHWCGKTRYTLTMAILSWNSERRKNNESNKIS